MPTGTITNTTVIDGTNESGYTSFTVPATYLHAGSNTLAVEVHQASASSTDVSFNLELTGTVNDTSPPTSMLLAARSAGWKYLDNGSNQGTSWRGVAFSDTAWPTGTAQLGYGDGDESTTVGYGGNASSKFITTYFRKSFLVPNPAVVAGLKLRLLVDDGAVVYLNGTEVFRSSMPAGVVTNATLASATIDNAGEQAWVEATTSPSLFVAGSNSTNVLAIEVHQVSATSTDISLDAELVSIALTAPAAPSGLTASGMSSSQISLGWTDNSTNEASFSVERSADGVTFAQIASVPAGTVSFVNNGGLLPGDSYHYRVRAVNAAGNSAYSNVAVGTTTAAPPSSGAPAPDWSRRAPLGSTWTRARIRGRRGARPRRRRRRLPERPGADPPEHAHGGGHVHDASVGGRRWR
jgi:hypothetical protein